MFQIKLKINLPIVSVIILALSLFPSTNSWNDYNSDYNNDYNGYQPFPYQFGRPFFPSQCRCIMLKYCEPVKRFLTKTIHPITPSLADKIKSFSCGYYENEPMVCCPDPRMRRSNFHHRSFYPSTEKPWVWDVEENTEHYHHHNHDFYNNFNQIPDGSKYEGKMKEFHAHFEDLKTHKNCPPSFSEEFDLAPSNETPVVAVAVDPTTVAPDVPTADPSILDRAGKKSLINAGTCGISINTRIIGGEDAGPGQFPWMARLAYRNKTSTRVTYRCAGSVISDRYIVTAAHCVTNLIDELEVVQIRLGELDTRTEADCTADQSKCTESQDFNIEKITPHAMYDTPKYANDIALVRLMSSTNPSTFITPLCLPVDSYASADENLLGTTGIISGWGSMTAGSNNPSPILQFVRLPIVNTTGCAQTYSNFSANSRTPIIVSESQLCVQGRENMDACQGDSGGPLMNGGVSGQERYTLLGLVSFGPRTCGVSNFPGVYTRISAYMDWIMDNMQI